jgi:hypothetical protein
VIFVDDKDENVIAARALAIRAFVFGESTVHTLREMLDSPVSKGWRYLFTHAKQSNSITNTGVAFKDNFARLLIVDTLQDG